MLSPALFSEFYLCTSGFPFRLAQTGAALLQGEALAALTVAFVMVPQAVTHASLAAMPLIAGLYTSFLPLLLATLFNRQTRLSFGPWALTSMLVLGLAHLLFLRLQPRIIEVGVHPDGSLRDRRLWKLAPLAIETYALRMDAEPDFASAIALERAVMEHLSSHPLLRQVWLFAQSVNRVDATGTESPAQAPASTRHCPPRKRVRATRGAGTTSVGRIARRFDASSLSDRCGGVAGI